MIWQHKTDDVHMLGTKKKDNNVLNIDTMFTAAEGGLDAFHNGYTGRKNSTQTLLRWCLRAPGAAGIVVYCVALVNETPACCSTVGNQAHYRGRFSWYRNTNYPTISHNAVPSKRRMVLTEREQCTVGAGPASTCICVRARVHARKPVCVPASLINPEKSQLNHQLDLETYYNFMWKLFENVFQHKL